MKKKTENNIVFQVLAKSKPEILLTEHIEDCLHVAKQLLICFPQLPIKNHKAFWKLLFYSVIFHDTGKAHIEFQRILYGKVDGKGKWYNQRHELFSLYFIHQANLSQEDKRKVSYVVGGHHKSAADLCYFVQHTYDTEMEGCLSYERECSEKLWKNKVWKMLEKYGFTCRQTDVIDICNVVNELYKHLSGISDSDFIEKLLLVGFMKHADHIASAGIKKLYKLSDADFSFLFTYPLYEHQQQAFHSDNHAILSAPTGSGKTETSILWLKKQLDDFGEGRVFYILPFTASINAMYERLSKCFGEKGLFVGMLHGKLLQYIENKMHLDDNSSVSEVQRILLEDFKSLVTPMKIVTPFQLLKHLFGLKGFEKGIAEWCGGYFIFDEIHAYDSRTFAQIIVLLEFIVNYMNAHVFVMTATLPSFMLSILSDRLKHYEHIVAAPELYDKFNRHRICLERGKIQDSLAKIQGDLNAGKSVLVVCNTVELAQEVYLNLYSSKKLLIHGSFNAEDRVQKELELQEGHVELLVGTQAIEVSLDIDYDTIYTEPAPIDALIQRFGRVNRKRQKGICLCHVFDERNEKDKFIYPDEYVQRTLSVLAEIVVKNQGLILEKEIQKIVDFVYPDWDKESISEFETTYRALSYFVSHTLSPLSYDSKSEEDFYKQFSGIKVLPACLRARYQEYLDKKQFVKADGLLVSISESRLWSLLKDNSVESDTFYYEGEKETLYNKDIKIILRRYDKDLGLRINEKDQFIEDQFL